MNTHSEEYRPDIDGLRAIALLIVLGYHAFPFRLAGGFVGVDVFFVISGFLITSIILRGVDTGQFSFTEFYSRRVRRIFPALIVVLLFCLAVGWFQMWTSEFRQLGRHILAAAGFVSNFVLWSEAGYFDTASETKPLLHLWSLGIEEQYYLIWPLLIWIVVKLRRSIAPLVGTLLVLSFALNIWLVNRYPEAAFYLPFPRFWEIMLGSALAYAFARDRVPFIAKFRGVLSFVGLSALVGAIVLLHPEYSFPGWWALLPSVGTLFMIAAGPDAWVNRHLLSRKILVFIGLISYPVYLWHWPLLVFLRIAYNEVLSARLRLGALALSFILGWLTYVLLERRVRTAPAKRLAPALCVILAVIGLSGFAVSASRGVPARFPDTLRNMDRYALFSPEISAEWRRHRCMLETETTFAPECIETEPANAPLAVLWGDSHAAAMYPAMRALKERYGVRVAQFSTRRCPPIVGFVSPSSRLDSPQCLSFNTYVASKIRELHPRIVFMTSWWSIYDASLLRSTIDSLRAAGVERVVLVGDVPVWNQNPARVMFHLYKQNGSVGLPPRVAESNFRSSARSESEISRIAREAGVDFLSMHDLLCDASGCLASVNGILAYTDGNHISPPVARTVAGQAFGKFIE